jgi:hypothetical protein
VYVYSLWDGTAYVSEEVKHRRETPGKAAILAASAQAIFGEVVSLAGLLAAAFYILTALATIA